VWSVVSSWFFNVNMVGPLPWLYMQLIFMGLKNISKKWTMPVRDWGAALNQFAIIYGEDRVPL
jgi:transposase-like protein